MLSGGVCGRLGVIATWCDPERGAGWNGVQKSESGAGGGVIARLNNRWTLGIGAHANKGL